MSSTSTGPYKSRLFNFINRQYIQFNDHFEKTIRHLKVAAEWGVQVLVYPVYLLVQTGRTAVRQLQQKTEQTQSLISTTKSEQPQLKSDQAIEAVLEDVNSWLSAPLSVNPHTPIKESLLRQVVEKTSDGTNVSTTVTQSTKGKQVKIESTIQGLATVLETKKLVLITQENQILDILSQKQQQKLQERIVWEIANYWHEQRLKLKTQQVPGHLPNISSSNPHMILPVRLFWQTMNWVQTSPLAIALNLFQESNNVCILEPSANFNSPQTLTIEQLQLEPNGVLASLDDTVADLEIHNLTPVTNLVQTLSAPLRDRIEKIGQKIEEKLNSQSTDNLEISEPNSFQIQALIYAAINYFFGQHQEQVHTENNNSSEAIPKTQTEELTDLPRSSSIPLPKTDISEAQTIEDSQESPWLSLSDLFNELKPTLTSEPKIIPTKGDRLQNIQAQNQDKEGLNTSHNTTAPIEISKTYYLKIQTLIWRAIDYFFGKYQPNQLLSQGNQNNNNLQQIASKQSKSNHKLPGSESFTLPETHLPLSSIQEPSKTKLIEDPWLSWDDLFDDTNLIENNSETSSFLPYHNSSQNPHLPSASPTPTKTEKSPQSSIQHSLYQQNKPNSLQSIPSTSKDLVKGKKQETTLSQPSYISSANTLQKTTETIVKTEDTFVESKPNWVETEATTVGYVKHPLERILEWLDLIILWLEEFVIRIWQLLSNLFKGNK